MSQHEQIKEILLNHSGKQNAIKSPEIASQIGIDPGPSNVIIRTLITQTLKKYHLPISGNPALGYYLIETKQELRETLKSLDSRIQEITDRKAYIAASYFRLHEDEELELTGEIIDNSDYEEEGNSLDL
ncbi:MAG: hypothetical protein ACFFCV_11610 [Promethearchaeota archaeon]